MLSGKIDCSSVQRSEAITSHYPRVVLLGIFSLCFLCDNFVIVQCINSGISPYIMSLLRNLFLSAARHSFTVAAQHNISGIHNNIADALSRFHMQEFHRLAPQASPLRTLLPPPPPPPVSTSSSSTTP